MIAGAQMRNLCLIPLAVLLIASGDPAPDDSIQSHDPRLVGVWKVVGVETSDPQARLFDLKITVTITTAKIVFSYGGAQAFQPGPGPETFEFAYTAHPGPLPCWIDVHAPGTGAAQGIYAFDGKQLKVFVPSSGQRPRDFKSFTSKTDGVFILERQRP